MSKSASNFNVLIQGLRSSDNKIKDNGRTSMNVQVQKDIMCQFREVFQFDFLLSSTTSVGSLDHCPAGLGSRCSSGTTSINPVFSRCSTISPSFPPPVAHAGGYNWVWFSDVCGAFCDIHAWMSGMSYFAAFLSYTRSAVSAAMATSHTRYCSSF